jgi:hypothetical protein
MTDAAITNIKRRGWFVSALFMSCLWVGITASSIVISFTGIAPEGEQMGGLEIALNSCVIVLMIGGMAIIPFIFIGLPAHYLLQAMNLTSGRTYMSFGAVLGGGIGAMIADFGMIIPNVSGAIAFDDPVKLAIIWGGAFITGGSALIGWSFWNRANRDTPR